VSDPGWQEVKVACCPTLSSTVPAADPPAPRLTAPGRARRARDALDVGGFDDTLALGTDHQALDVGVGVVLGLVLPEGRGKPLVELDQALGRCAHVVFGHGGSLLTEPRIDDELASSSMLCSQPTWTP